MPLFYEIALTQQDLLSWDDIPDNVTDEIKIIKLLIRDKLLAQKRFKESNANESAQQVFDFGGSVETFVITGDNKHKKNVILKHDYGQKTLRGLFITLKDLLSIHLEYLKFNGEKSDAIEKSLLELVRSIEKTSSENE